MPHGGCFYDRGRDILSGVSVPAAVRCARRNPHEPTQSKEECCQLCRTKPDCAAGIWSPPTPGGDCWLKTLGDVKSGAALALALV